MSPAVELELNAGPLRLDGLPPGAGAAGPGLRVAQVRLLDRRTSSRPSSRPGTPTSNTSSTPTPSEDQNDGDEEAAEPEDEVQGAELEGATLSAPTPRLLKRPFQLLIAAAMERNPTQFQLPSELTCTTALPGQFDIDILNMFRYLNHHTEYSVLLVEGEICCLTLLWTGNVLLGHKLLMTPTIRELPSCPVNQSLAFFCFFIFVYSLKA